jgi:hypothetical protein
VTITTFPNPIACCCTNNGTFLTKRVTKVKNHRRLPVAAVEVVVAAAVAQEYERPVAATVARTIAGWTSAPCPGACFCLNRCPPLLGLRIARCGCAIAWRRSFVKSPTVPTLPAVSDCAYWAWWTSSPMPWGSANVFIKRRYRSITLVTLSARLRCGCLHCPFVW